MLFGVVPVVLLLNLFCDFVCSSFGLFFLFGCCCCCSSSYCCCCCSYRCCLLLYFSGSTDRLVNNRAGKVYRPGLQPFQPSPQRYKMMIHVTNTRQANIYEPDNNVHGFIPSNRQGLATNRQPSEEESCLQVCFLIHAAMRRKNLKNEFCPSKHIWFENQTRHFLFLGVPPISKQAARQRVPIWLLCYSLLPKKT